jgi:hypothetical protein
MSVKNNGTWVLDLSQTGEFDPQTYDLTIQIQAEGKTFTGTSSVEVTEES